MAVFKKISVLIAGVSSISLVRREGNVDANGFTSIVNLGIASAPETTDGMDSPGTHGMAEGKGKGQGGGKGKGQGGGKGKGEGKSFVLPKPGSGCARGPSPVVVCMFRVNAKITHVYYNDTDMVSKSKDKVLPTDAEHPTPGLMWMFKGEDMQKETEPEVFHNGGEGKLVGVSFEDVPGAVLAIGADAASNGKSGTCDDTALTMLCTADKECSKWNFWSASTTTVRSFGHTDEPTTSASTTTVRSVGHTDEPTTSASTTTVRSFGHTDEPTTPAPEKSGKKPTSSMLSIGQDDPVPGTIDGHWYKRDFDDKAWGVPCESKSNLTLGIGLPVTMHPQKIWSANKFSYFPAKD